MGEKPEHRSPGRVEQEKKLEVLEMLPRDGSRIRWSSLEREARTKGMSLRTLRKNLDKLELWGFVERTVDPNKRPPAVCYNRRDLHLFPIQFSEQARLCAELDLVGEIVDGGKFKPGTEGLYEQALKVNLLMMKAALPVILHASLGGRGPYKEKPGDQERGGAVDRLLKRMHEDTHSLADELLDVVLRPWVHKMLDVLEAFSSSAKEVLGEAAEPELREAAEALKRYDELLEPYRRG
jgi:hypothetical protein